MPIIVLAIESFLITVVSFMLLKRFDKMSKNNLLEVLRSRSESDRYLRQIRAIRDELLISKDEEELKAWKAYINAHSMDYSPLAFLLGFIIAIFTVVLSFILSGNYKYEFEPIHYILGTIILFILVSWSTMAFIKQKEDAMLLNEAISLVLEKKNERHR